MSTERAATRPAIERLRAADVPDMVIARVVGVSCAIVQQWASGAVFGPAVLHERVRELDAVREQVAVRGDVLIDSAEFLAAYGHLR